MTEQVEKVALKPCAFCGGEPDWIHHRIGGTGSSGMESPNLSIGCKKCGYEFKSVSTEKWEKGKGTLSTWGQAEKTLIAAWNTRTPPDDSVARIVANNPCKKCGFVADKTG